MNIELLAVSLHSLASKYGSSILPESCGNVRTLTKDDNAELMCDQDQLFVSLYRSGFLDVIPLGTPISNSQSSTLLQTAVLESIVAKELTGRILQELFPWAPAGESILLRNVLEDLTQTDP